MQIEDGTGKGYLTKVTSDNQLKVRSESRQIQHHVSINHKQAYQVSGLTPSVTSGNNTLLLLQNTSSDKYCVFTYLRMQVVDLTGGTTATDKEHYFQIGFNTSYTSGGDLKTPINMNTSSANLADVIVYENKPIVSGSIDEIDRRYIIDENQYVWNKEGSLILGQNDYLEIRLVTDHTSGEAWARMSFLMVDYE
jgi:hypothetical protein